MEVGEERATTPSPTRSAGTATRPRSRRSCTRSRPAVGERIAPVTFVPHLMPFDQGELVSCYVAPSASWSGEELRELYESRYGGERFVELVDAPPGVSEVRGHQPLPHPRPRRRGRPGLRLRGDRQPLEGRRLAGDPEPEPDAGAPGGGGDLLTCDAARDRPSSRAAGSTFPSGVEEVDPAELAPGFRAAGVACGLKGGGETDVGVLVCDAERVSSALALTANASAAAPVRLCRDECDAGAIRAVAVNSGNANASTGEQGYRDAVADARRGGRGARPRAPARRDRRDRHDRGPAGCRAPWSQACARPRQRSRSAAARISPDRS